MDEKDRTQENVPQAEVTELDDKGLDGVAGGAGAATGGDDEEDQQTNGNCAC